MEQKKLYISALPDYPEEIGRQLWMMEDVRRDLLHKLQDVTQEELDTPLDDNLSTIASLLYHIAEVETSWLYFDLLEQKKLAPHIEPWFPRSARSESGEIYSPPGESLEDHLNRLSVVRSDFLEKLRSVDLEDWRTFRSLPGEYDVTPEWIVYHLIEHEAHHRGQIFRILGTLRRR
ncbi:DinB family protein [Saccharibacillus kuerlensis]|uniref:DinB-like domain-containing protein n=1 Tax=Saccharibacillus kuerlensis TaxID=459527 RepID=A0ABQ2L8U8_9BACL|nr:DinB family protein [Saccharibacillus kuerlensis]GGO05957.1 hypothetical protein GCM10010969_32850 [Saccharibacillus kuerlensis]